MATSNDLIQDVYANFLSVYAHNTGTRNTVISFEAVGLSPSLDPAAPGSKTIALEYISNEANWLPDLSNGDYERTMRTLSVSYANLINTAIPVSEAGAAIFNSMKASAVEALHNFDLGSVNGPSTYKPTYTTPQAWYDPAQATGWANYSYATGKPVAPGPPPIIRPPIWRMMTRGPMAVTVAPAVAAVPAVAAGPAAADASPKFVMKSAMLNHAVFAHAFDASNATPAMQTVNQAALVHSGLQTAQFNPRIAIDSDIIHLNPLIVNNSGDQPVLQPSFSMSFQYCIVELNRPWFSGDLLANEGWYVPGQHEGDFSTGSAPPAPTDGTAASASNLGFLAWVPVAFIAVKNLVIRSTGGALDPSVTQTVTSFGPFSVAPGNSTDALSNVGIEIIAWVCTAQPPLPPQTDPALLPPPPKRPDSTATTVGNLVNLFEQLLG